MAEKDSLMLIVVHFIFERLSHHFVIIFFHSAAYWLLGVTKGELCWPCSPQGLFAMWHETYFGFFSGIQVYLFSSSFLFYFNFIYCLLKSTDVNVVKLSLSPNLCPGRHLP